MEGPEETPEASAESDQGEKREGYARLQLMEDQETQKDFFCHEPGVCHMLAAGSGTNENNYEKPGSTGQWRFKCLGKEKMKADTKTGASSQPSASSQGHLQCVLQPSRDAQKGQGGK